MTQISAAAALMSLVNDPAVTLPGGAKIHEDYLATATAGGFTYAPKRDNAKKQKPNILPFALLSPAVRSQNIAPFESVFGYVTQQVDEQGIETLEDLRSFVAGLLDESGKKVPSPELGERTWQAWASHARTHEPTHPNLVASYDLLDSGTKDYDLVLNATAVNYLLTIVDAAINKKNVDSASAN